VSAGTLLIRDAILDGEVVSILVRDGLIAAIEPGAEAASRPDARAPIGPGTGAASGSDTGATPAPGERPDRVIEAAGLHAFPSLHNAHTHAAMTLFRGWGDDLPLMEWLRTRIWPAEALLTEDDVYLGTRLACLEMIRGGTTYLNDMYWHHPGVTRAVREMGLRAHVGAVFIDFGDGDAARRQRDAVLRQLDARDALGPRTRVALTPHAIYTVTPASLEWVGELARQEDLIVHTHLSETRDEVEDCLAEHGVRPARLLEQVGLLDTRLVAAHGVYLDRDELELLAEHGATIATNPNANLKLAIGGIFDYAGARDAGLRVVLGTDGAASNNNLDMIEEMKTVALVQKHRAGDATCLPAHEALDLATRHAGDAFGLGTGRLQPGAPADLILVDLSHPSTQPVHDPVSALVYAANGRAVHTTLCDGQVLMHDGQVEVADEREVVDAAVRAARALVGRAG
jgi:5-methylthioadenosine/S-adenosylhomocysteine deaminase